MSAKAFPIIGGLSQTSAMPCLSYSIPARHCQTGRKLSTRPGTVCSLCYACKGRYAFGNVQTALERRYACTMRALADTGYRQAYVAEFTAALVGEDYFRWHDSGDLQSTEHFALIADIARATPGTMHWLPTRELRHVPRSYPDNLTVRYSLPMIDGRLIRCRLPQATVHSSQSTLQADAFECRKPYQGNACGTCRACWDPHTRLVSYALH